MTTQERFANLTVIDITVEDHGSILVMTGVTQAGKDWLDASLADGQRWAGGYVIEPRYLHDVFMGAVNDGLEVVRA